MRNVGRLPYRSAKGCQKRRLHLYNHHHERISISCVKADERRRRLEYIPEKQEHIPCALVQCGYRDTRLLRDGHEHRVDGRQGHSGKPGIPVQCALRCQSEFDINLEWNAGRLRAILTDLSKV